jgi:ATP-dependent Clp protease ATP-binding subunit ClpC
LSTSFTIPVYQKKLGSTIQLITLGLGEHTQTRTAQGIPKAEEQLRDDLRKLVQGTQPAALGKFDLKRGTRLERVRITVNLKDDKRRKVSGLCPIVVEPRYIGDYRNPLGVCYHPSRQAEWFAEPRFETLADAAAAYFASTWAELDDEEIKLLWTNAKDSLKVISFTAREKNLLQELPQRKKGLWDDLEIDPTRAEKRKRDEMKVLPQIATDLTSALQANTDLGLPRSPYREQLQVLIGGKRRQSVVLIGDSGSGKSTIVRQLVSDLLSLDGFETHRNLDKVTHVWRLSGRQLIAGMSRVGQWEQRCVELLDDLRGRKIVLLIPDLHLFGRIGRARDSDRALSDFFRGPAQRGEVIMLGECTRDQFRRIEEDDASFASAFVKLHVRPANRAETFKMMLARAREIEVTSPETAPIEIQPLAFETILQLGEGLFPSHALPGKAVDLLVRLCSATGRRHVGPNEVVEHLSRDTGLPWVLLTPDKPLTVEEIAQDLTARVMGQPQAVAEAADLVVRIRSGLTDPKRPYGVYLFTGPTGTGKTELAKALAEYLYGSGSGSSATGTATTRLIRFDMSELSGPDAVARLIGDAWTPEGQLTSAAMAQPFSVVLLDEIEKAHPAVLNLLLQLFDDGRLTDAAGSTASFTQTVIVMTSNLGARQRPPVGFGESPDALMHDVARAVREFFPPELFNRIDAVVPFRPLTPEVAIDVTKKELSKLFTRSGLVERNVFVQVGRAAIERIAKESLRAEDGARSLKRFIEDQIGSLLGQQIAKAPGAALQVMRIIDTPSGLLVESEPLVEAEPVAGRYALEGLWTKPLGELRDELPEAMNMLDRLERSDQLVALCETLRHHLSEHNLGKRESGELLYNIDWMRVTIEKLRERIERFVIASREIQHHAIETAIAQKETHEAARWPWRSDPKPRPGRMRFDFGRAGGWWETFSSIAEVHVLERAALKVTGTDQHAVFVEMLPYGNGRIFLENMFDAYSRLRGEVDDIAWLDNEGNVETHPNRDQAREKLPKCDLVVMKIVGLCIKDYLELESGTHVWQPSVREPELLRVRILPAPSGMTAKQHVATYVELKERADREGLPSVERPDRLLPVVRKIHFDPPPPRRAATLLEMEDFVLGMPYSTRVTAIADAFATLWLLRVSRIDANKTTETGSATPS